MFKLENDDAYVGLQAPISIDETIQPTVIVGGFTLNVVLDGREDDGANSDQEYAGCSNNDD
jgi:hypothetical protein